MENPKALIVAASASPWQRSLRDHRALFLLACAYGLSVFALALYLGIFGKVFIFTALGFAMWGLMAMSVFALILVFGFLRELRLPPASGAGLTGRWKDASLRNDARMRRYVDGEIFVYAVTVLAIASMTSFFAVLKSMISRVNPYSLDPYFAEADRLLHGGFYPHRLLIPLVDKLRLGYALDILYSHWLPVMSLFLIYVFFLDARLHRRMRFIFTYFLSWFFLGSGGALLCASVGPLFFGDFYPQLVNPYADLLAHHQGMAEGARYIPYITEEIRQLLLAWAQNDDRIGANDLSAMPSMHVGITWLMVLYSRHLSRFLFIAMSVYFAAILAGSVYLGFHYAIDGYVSLAFVSLIWWLVGKRVKKRYPAHETHILSGI